ncbi:MAG: hypothetical protein HY327_08280 [Chloroflexi bacterium]|nr:hypothetical protein [Chloroflexota bacterium]
MKKVKREPIPKEFHTLKEAGEFWDTHSAADYSDLMEEVDLQVDIQSRRFVVMLDDEVYRVAQARAKSEHISPDELVNQLLRKELTGA